MIAHGQNEFCQVPLPKKITKMYFFSFHQFCQFNFFILLSCTLLQFLSYKPLHAIIFYRHVHNRITQTIIFDMLLGTKFKHILL